MQDPQDRALAYVRHQGPILPVQLAKALSIDLTLAGALLSELYAHKQVFMSTAKIGTSKMYYVPGQEPKLQILADHLGATPRKAYDLLKDSGVVKDSECTPWQRVAYREMNDFAKPFQHNNEVYWRWYLLSEEEALQKITVPEPTPVEPPQVVEQETQITQEPEIKPPPKPPKQKDHKELRKEEFKPEKQAVLDVPPLPPALQAYITQNNLLIRSVEFVKKTKDIELLATIHSQIGGLPHLVIYLDKKKLSDGDLSLVYTRGQRKRAPVLLLTPGELTKKAQTYLEKEYHGSIVFRRI